MMAVDIILLQYVNWVIVNVMTITTFNIGTLLRAARVISMLYCLPAGGAGEVHTRLDRGSEIPQCE